MGVIKKPVDSASNGGHDTTKEVTTVVNTEITYIKVRSSYKKLNVNEVREVFGLETTDILREQCRIKEMTNYVLLYVPGFVAEELVKFNGWSFKGDPIQVLLCKKCRYGKMCRNLSKCKFIHEELLWNDDRYKVRNNINKEDQDN